MPELAHYLQTYFFVSEAEQQVLSELFEVKSIKKGDFFVKSGHYCNEFLQILVIRKLPNG
jgi:hypothetical protein